MDESFLKEQTARCRTLAGVSNDPFIKKRLLDLADRYEDTLLGKPPQKFIKTMSPLDASFVLPPGEK